MIIANQLFTTAQEDRVATLRTEVPAWINRLEEKQLLVVGLPKVLGSWDEAVPLVMPARYEEQFLEWLAANEKDILGPCYNLPKLNASFQLVIIDAPYAELEIPADADKSLCGTLASFQKWYEAHTLASAG